MDIAGGYKKSRSETFLSTAGGKITCARCAAKSKRTGNQCGKPALKGKAVCQFHGGRSTGPKSEAGKARQRAAVLKNGHYTKEAIEDRARSVRMLAGLEDAMYVMEMTNSPRTRGRKPKGYKPLVTLDDVKRFVLDNPLHLPERSDEQDQK
jgi:hypothetical protein